MKSYEKILDDVSSHRYVSESGPILEFIRQLAAQGEIEQVSEFIREYVRRAPESRQFILYALPAMILNSYIYPRSQVTFERFLEWSETESEWAQEIRDSALSPEAFVSNVSNILVGLR